jgi:hypothetical protein
MISLENKMTYEYVRVDMIKLLAYGAEANWFHNQPDCEWREDYQWFFILKGSPTHTAAAMKFGDIFD